MAKTKKKATKKKSTKKKAAKKKTTKKKSAAAKPRKGIRIRITNWEADNENPRGKQRKSSHAPDSVYWTSKDREYTVTFTGDWPFQRKADVGGRTISVPAGGESKTFTLDDDAQPGQYGYDIQAVTPAGQPPEQRPSKPGQPQPTPEVGVDP